MAHVHILFGAEKRLRAERKNTAGRLVSVITTPRQPPQCDGLCPFAVLIEIRTSAARRTWVHDIISMRQITVNIKACHQNIVKWKYSGAFRQNATTVALISNVTEGWCDALSQVGTTRPLPALHKQRGGLDSHRRLRSRDCRWLTSRPGAPSQQQSDWKSSTAPHFSEEIEESKPAAEASGELLSPRQSRVCWRTARQSGSSAARRLTRELSRES